MMTETKSAPTKPGVKPTSSPKSPDINALLIADHLGVSDLFEDYEKAKANCLRLFSTSMAPSKRS